MSAKASTTAVIKGAGVDVQAMEVEVGSSKGKGTELSNDHGSGVSKVSLMDNFNPSVWLIDVINSKGKHPIKGDAECMTAVQNRYFLFLIICLSCSLTMKPKSYFLWVVIAPKPLLSSMVASIPTGPLQGFQPLLT